MTETAKRTPGPWKVRPSYSGADYTFIYSDTNERIALFHKEEDAQAAVVAVECHDELVAALEEQLAADDALTAFLLAADPKELGEAEWQRQHLERSNRKRAATTTARAALTRRMRGS